MQTFDSYQSTLQVGKSGFNEGETPNHIIHEILIKSRSKAILAAHLWDLQAPSLIGEGQDAAEPWSARKPGSSRNIARMEMF